MADAQVNLKDGTSNIGRNAEQWEIDTLKSWTGASPFAKVGDFLFAVDMLASAYMLDGESVPAERGHRYTEADLTEG